MFIGSGIRLRSTGNGPALASDFTIMSELPADYTFTRASQGKYFDSSGVLRNAAHNLFSYSGAPANAYWSVQGSTRSTSSEVAPDGVSAVAQIAITSNTGNNFYKHYTTLVTGATYTMSAWVKGVVGERVFLSPTSDQQQTTVTFTGEWQRVSFAAVAVAVNNYASFEIYNRAGGSHLSLVTFHVTQLQYELNTAVSTYVPTTTAAVYNGPRFDHVYDGSAWVAKGLLIEGARTNLALQSNAFDTTWVNNLSIDTAASGTSPDGSNNAWKITDDSSGGAAQVYVYQDMTLTNAAYTISAYAKADQLGWAYIRTQNFTTNGISWFNLSTGVVGTLGHTSSGIESVDDGWYRIWVVTTPGADAVGRVWLALTEANGSTVATADGTSSILIYGAQCELGAFPSSYIPTTTASATRAADVCTVTGLDTAPWFNAAEGTWLVEADVTSASNFGYLFSANSGSSAGLIGVRYISSNPEFFVNTASSAVVQIDAGTALAASSRAAGAYKVNDYAVSYRGGAVGTDTVGAMPTGITTLSVGSSAAAAAPLFGHIANLTYWPTRLANTTLQALTS